MHKRTMKKNKVFVAGMLAVLTFGLVLAGCKDSPDDPIILPSSGGQINRPEPSNYFPAGKGYISLYGNFAPNVAMSTLPGFDVIWIGTAYKSDTCGFSVVTSGSALTVTRISVYDNTDITIDVDRPFEEGEQLSVSYVPDGVHIFKNKKGTSLAAFSGLSVIYTD